MVLYGVPVQLDSVLRPFARMLQLAIAVPLTLILVWLGQWLWVPLPLALSFLVYEAFFYARGDRPCRVTLTDTLVLDDPVRGQQLVVRPAEIHTAALLRDEASVTVVLGDDLGVAFVGRFDGPATRGIALLDFEDILGQPAGLVRALGPNERVCRQRVTDPRGALLSWLDDHVSRDAWSRTRIRLWQGEAPDLDVFALHKGPPTGVLLLEGDRWQLGDESGILGRVLVSWARRQAVLLRPGEGQILSAHDIPLLVLTLSETVQIAIPAPVSEAPADRPAPPDTAFHTHQPEGILLIHHLRRVLSEDALPTDLLRATVAADSGSP